ncbi:hypothetical protein ACKWTF_014134 [Chironomus riparius]
MVDLINMKLLIKIVLLFIVGLSTSTSQHVSLVGSRQVPTDSDFRVYLAAQDLTTDSIVNVTLQSDLDYGVSKVFDGVSGDLSQEIEFKLPQNRQSDYKLNIVHKNKVTNKCMKQSVAIGGNSNRHMIFIHHDKPVYKNDDMIRFRTFVLDRDMLPYRYTSMNVSILDGRRNVIKKFENVQSTSFGVFEGYVMIAESPNLGEWRIEVNVDGRTRSKHFPVKNHEKSNFEVVIQSMDKEVPFEDVYIFLRIQAKNPVNKMFNGIAKISSSTRLDGKSEPLLGGFIKNVTLPLDKPEVSLRIDNDLGIRSPQSDMITTLIVEVFEDKTRHYEKVTVDVPLRMYRNRLQLTRNPSFKPGFDFDMNIKAKTLNGQPDMSLRQLTMNVDYENFDEDTQQSSTDKKQFNLNLKKGELDVVLQPAAITRSIKVIFEFGGTELTDRIVRKENNGIHEYMQATIANKKQLYDPTETLQITAKSSHTLQTLHVLVIGSTGLLYSKSFPEAHDKESFKFSLTLSEQMSPQAYIVTFYTRAEDGVMIGDELMITLKHSARNWIEISPAVQSTKPREFVKININSTKDSLVFLTAVDQNATLLGHDNDITQLFLHSEVARYMNQNSNSTYDLGHLNSFVLQPLVSGVPCDANDVVRSAMWNDQDQTLEDKLNQKYFPDVWLEEQIEIKNQEFQTIQRQVPNELTSWIIYGTSMHPTKGIAIVEQEARVSLFNEISLKVNAPTTVHNGEVLNIELNVFNFLKTSQSVQVTVTVENGDTMDEKTSTVNRKVCKTYTRRRNPAMTYTQPITANSMSPTHNVFVQPLALGFMRIKVTATGASGVTDEVSRVIEVQERRQLRQTIVESALIDIVEQGSVKNNVVLNVPDNVEVVDVYAMFTGNLLGPVLRNLDLFRNVPMDYREPKSSSFMLSMIVAEYHQSRHDEIPTEVTDAMLKGYQETLESLQSDTNAQKSALFYVYATFALIKAKSFIDVDDSIIEMSLDYLKGKQGSDGSFMDRTDEDVGQMSSPRQILTAQFTLAFIKYQTYSNKYDDVIVRAIKFLDSSKTDLTTDYEKVLVAYTLSAHGDQESSKMLTSSMTCTFANNPDFKQETSLYVGIASFLVELKINEGVDPKIEVEWLLRHRQPNGMFFSPHDTLSGLHALLSYQLNRNTKRVNLQVSVDGQTGIVTESNENLRLKLSQKNQYTIRASGEGLGYATIYYEYIERGSTTYPPRNFLMAIKADDLPGNMLDIKIDVKMIAPGLKTSNLAVLEVEMPSGYEFYNQTNSDNFKKVDYWKERTVAVFYIESMDANLIYSVAMQAVKVYQVEYTAKSAVKIYDYYRPNIIDEIHYDNDVNMQNCKPNGNQEDINPIETTTKKNGFWPFG